MYQEGHVGVMSGSDISTSFKDVRELRAQSDVTGGKELNNCGAGMITCKRPESKAKTACARSWRMRTLQRSASTNTITLDWSESKHVAILETLSLATRT